MSAEADLVKPARQAAPEPGVSFDLTPSDEQRMMVDAVRDFAARQVRPAAAEADHSCRTPPPLLAAAGALGLSATGIPTAHGGPLDERATVTSALIAEALAEGDMGIAVACLAPGGVATALGLWGDAEQQATHLPALAAEMPPAAAIAIMEPRALFDPFALRTQARRTAGGDILLDGVKSLVPRGAECGLLLVAAAVDGGPSLLLVEPNAGTSVVPAPGMGVRSAATASITFEQVRLPQRALLGESDPQVYAELVARSRLAWSALAVGTGAAVLAYVSEYVNQRTAFGEPISNRQSVAFMVADMATEIESIRLATLRACSLAESGRPFTREAALAHALTVAQATAIGSDGVQLLGGHGYTREHPVERWFRDLRAAGIFIGALAL